MLPYNRKRLHFEANDRNKLSLHIAQLCQFAFHLHKHKAMFFSLGSSAWIFVTLVVIQPNWKRLFFSKLSPDAASITV